MNFKLIDYEEWRSSNEKGFTLFDYLRGKQMAGECSPDILVAFARLIFPELLQKEGMIFLKEQFCQVKFDQLRSQGLDSSEIEYWINLLAVGDLTPLIPESFLEDLMPKIKRSWEVVLTDAYPDKVFDVKLIQDDGNTFLVFSQNHTTTK